MSTQFDLGPVMMVPKGDWNAETTYERLNLVRYGATAWVCIVDTSIGVEPGEESTDWTILAKDTSSVTSVNGQTGDVTVSVTNVETPPADDSSTRIATTEWVTDKLGDVDLSGIKDDTILAALNASGLPDETGELSATELAAAISALETDIVALESANFVRTVNGESADEVGNVTVSYDDTEAAHAAMPSDNFISIAYSVNSIAVSMDYTPPADGYVMLSCYPAGTSGSRASICLSLSQGSLRSDLNVYARAANSGQTESIFLNVSGGRPVTIYTYNAVVASCIFVYANGTNP